MSFRSNAKTFKHKTNMTALGSYRCGRRVFSCYFISMPRILIMFFFGQGDGRALKFGGPNILQPPAAVGRDGLADCGLHAAIHCGPGLVEARGSSLHNQG